MIASTRLLFAFCASLGIAAAHAQDAFPSKTVRLIVPFPAAGPLDVMARLYAQKLSDRWGRPVIVDNRVGATGTIGTDAVVRAEPDGHTLLVTVDLPIVMAPNLIKAPYDPRKDLLPVAGLAETMNMLVVHPSLNVSTLAELVAVAKAQPGKIAFSSAGPASPGHVCGEMIKAAAGVDMVHVPYKGAAPAMVAVVAGEVGMFCGPVSQGLPHVKSGKLKVLGVTGRSRSPLAPDIAPLSDTYPNVVIFNWYGAFVPAGTPPAITAALGKELRALYDDSELAKRLAGMGVDPVWLTPAEVSQRIEVDLAKWAKVVRDLKIKP
jgi:tripartite-type tricarboxylate transporter receptor subunit TctC